MANLGLTVRTFANLQINVIAAWAFGLASLGYGAFQKKLRQSTIERLQGRITELETLVDSSRTSSDLTPRGETRPEDI